MKIVPTFDNVAVLLDEAQAMSAGGIALPDGVVSPCTTGKVVGKGGCVAIEIEDGDRVLLAEGQAYSNSPLQMDNRRRVVVVNQEHVIAVIKE